MPVPAAARITSAHSLHTENKLQVNQLNQSMVNTQHLEIADNTQAEIERQSIVAVELPKQQVVQNPKNIPTTNSSQQMVQIHLHIDGQSIAPLQNANATNASTKGKGTITVLQPIALGSPVAFQPQPNIVQASQALPIVMPSASMPQMVMPAMPPIQVVAPLSPSAISPSSIGSGLQEHLLASEIADRRERLDRAEREAAAEREERQDRRDRADRAERAERAEREAARAAELSRQLEHGAYAERSERADRLAQLSLLASDRSDRASREAREEQLLRMDAAERAERMDRSIRSDRAQAIQQQLMMMADREHQRDMSQSLLLDRLERNEREDRAERANRAERLLRSFSHRDTSEFENLNLLNSINRAKDLRLQKLRENQNFLDSITRPKDRRLERLIDPDLGMPLDRRVSDPDPDTYAARDDETNKSIDQVARTPPWIPWVDPSNDFDRDLMSFLVSQDRGSNQRSRDYPIRDDVDQWLDLRT